jgi:hypothetical protein
VRSFADRHGQQAVTGVIFGPGGAFGNAVKSTGTVMAAILFAGCANIASHERAHVLKLAVQDDHACQTQGWRYPQPRYITCRLQLEDKRQYKDWMSLQMMHQTHYQNLSAPPPYPYREVYKPLDRDHYRCNYVAENGQDYILCGEEPRT